MKTGPVALAAGLAVAVAACGGESETAGTTRPAPPLPSLPCLDRRSTIFDYTADARGERGEPLDVARSFLEDHGLRPADRVERATSTGSEAPWIRVVRAGEVVALVELRRSPNGEGWLVGQLETCPAFGP